MLFRSLLRHGGAEYHVQVRVEPGARARLTFDGVEQAGDPMLVADGGKHSIELVLPAEDGTASGPSAI